MWCIIVFLFCLFPFFFFWGVFSFCHGSSVLQSVSVKLYLPSNLVVLESNWITFYKHPLLITLILRCICMVEESRAIRNQKRHLKSCWKSSFVLNITNHRYCSETIFWNSQRWFHIVGIDRWKQLTEYVMRHRNLSQFYFIHSFIHSITHSFIHLFK